APREGLCVHVSIAPSECSLPVEQGNPAVARFPGGEPVTVFRRVQNRGGERPFRRLANYQREEQRPHDLSSGLGRITYLSNARLRTISKASACRTKPKSVERCSTAPITKVHHHRSVCRTGSCFRNAIGRLGQSVSNHR